MGRRVDLTGLDGGLEHIAGEGGSLACSHSLHLFLNEKSARAARGTQCVVVL